MAEKRLLHVVVYCLNYMYLGRHPSLDEIGRRPNAWQKSCFQRLRSLIFVCGLNQEEFPTVPGRSGPELGAALFQLESFLAKNPELFQNYAQHKPFVFKDDPGLWMLDSILS